MTVLYEKRGRRYVPVADSELYQRDMMRLGQFRLTYCYADGARRYIYDVVPATASFIAAAEVASEAMERAMTEAARLRPSQTLLTQAERDLVAEYQSRAAGMGLAWPTWWTNGSPRDIAAAGIRAVKEYAP